MPGVAPAFFYLFGKKLFNQKTCKNYIGRLYITRRWFITITNGSTMKSFRLGSLLESGEEEFGGVKIITKGEIKGEVGFSWSPNRVNHMKLFSADNKADWWLCRLALSGKMMATRSSIIPLVRDDHEIIVAIKSMSVVWYSTYDWMLFGNRSVGTNGAAHDMATLPFQSPQGYLDQWGIKIPAGEMVNLNTIKTIAEDRMSWGRVDKIPA
jgi:hypothetical protein